EGAGGRGEGALRAATGGGRGATIAAFETIATRGRPARNTLETTFGDNTPLDTNPEGRIDRMKTLALAMAMTIFTYSAALATDGPPTGPGDNTGRSGAAATTSGGHPSGGDVTDGAGFGHGVAGTTASGQDY